MVLSLETLSPHAVVSIAPETLRPVPREPSFGASVQDIPVLDVPVTDRGAPSRRPFIRTREDDLAGRRRPAPWISGSQTQPRLQPAETVVANHTAVRMDAKLSRSYVIQSVCTGLPLAIADMLVTAFSLVICSYVVNLSQGHVLNSGTWVQLPALLLLQFGLLSLHGLYPGAGISPVYELRGTIRSTLLAALSLSTINLLFGQLPRIEFAAFACTAIVVSFLLPLARHLARAALRERVGGASERS